MADVDEAKQFLREANDAESENRQLGLQALQFRYGDQWPAYAIASRGLERPQLTINETNTYIKKVTNSQRQQRPRGKASPVDDYADKKVAKIITGLGRHIEVNSDADHAYDTAFDFAATIGWGYWRLRHDYINEASFDQDIYIDPIDNPFNVYFDYNSRLPDGSDAERGLITELMAKAVFKKKHPGAQESSFSDRGTGDSDPDWVTDRDIRIAEYFYVDRVRAKLVLLSDGQAVWEDQLPPKEILLAAGVSIQGDRQSFKRTVKWQKMTGFEVLDSRTLPGKYIPIVPVYWTNVVIDSRRMRCGLVRDAMDPARMHNFWQTATTEYLALAPKAKWLIPEGGDEGHENEYKNANLAASATLHFKTTGVDGQPIPPPARIAPEMPPAGFIEASFMASQSLSRVMGVFDPAVRGGAQHKSDKTLNAERAQSENTNFEGYDNLTRSIKHTWRIMLSWIPTIYDRQRTARIIGEDGREEMVALNEHQQAQDPNGTGAMIDKVLNDVCVGTYDVVMQTGPGYDTRRQEGTAAMIELMATPLGEKVAAVADDVIVRQMDFPGADIIADRLAAANPLSQIDEKSDIPPAVQMKMKGMAQTIEQLQGQMQAMAIEAKARTGTAEINAHAKIMAAKISADGEREERQIQREATEVHAVTAQNIAEINGLVKILTTKGEHAQRARELLATFEHETNLHDMEQDAKAREDERAARQPIQ